MSKFISYIIWHISIHVFKFPYHTMIIYDINKHTNLYTY